MSKREVKEAGKDGDGVVSKVCNQDASWSPRSATRVIRDIESGRHSYFVDWSNQSTNGSKKTDIHVVDGEHGKYLRTDHDETEKNNLLELPSC